MVSDSTRTQVSPLDEVFPGAELEAVDVCISEVSTKRLVLSVVIALLEAAKVEARRVGDSSLEFSLEGLSNHELPQENRPAEGTKQTTEKEKRMSEVSGAIIADREKSAKDRAKSDEQSKKSSYGFSLLCQGRQNKHF